LYIQAQHAAAVDSALDTLVPIAPFINDETVLVAKYDLERLDVDTVVKQWLEPFAMTDEERNILKAVVEQFDGWSQQLKADGISQFYVVSSIEYFPSPERMRGWNQDLFARLLANTTFVVIPGASGNSIEVLHTTLQTNAKQVWSKSDPKMWPDCRQIHGAAVIGMGTLLDRLNGLKPAIRPKFETALAAADNRPICVAVVPPPFFARAATEILHEPVAGSNLSAGPIIANGFHWLALGEEPNLGKFQMQVIVQSASAEAAQALSEAIKSEAEALAKHWGSDAAAAVSAAQLLSLLPEAKDDRIVWSIDQQQISVVRGLAKIAFSEASAAAFREQSLNHLKQIGLAMLNSYSAHKQYPDHAIHDKDGKPLLSWRVAILPYVEEGALYKQFHLDEPWDSENNRKLIERMPDVYRSPDTGSEHPERTRYLAVVGEHSLFPPDRGVTIKEVTDGTSKTIMVVEVDPEHAVIWTKPDDLEVDLENPRRGLFNGSLPCNACWADGSAKTIRNDVDSKVLRALFTRDGDEAINPSSY
jgi:hypothetical protein